MLYSEYRVFTLHYTDSAYFVSHTDKRDITDNILTFPNLQP